MAATTNSISVSWQASTAAISYSIQYKKASASSWTSTSSTGTFKNISGLVTGTNYNYRVAMVCANGTSSYSSAGTISTMNNTSSCAVPSGLFVSEIIMDAVTLNWLPVAGANLYTVQYRKTGTSGWTSKTTSFTNKAISGLSTNTSYQFQVGTACSVNSSSYSASTTFSTNSIAGRMSTTNNIDQLNVLDTISLGEKSKVEIPTVQEFLLFPNPSPGNIFNLRIRLNQKETINIAVYDMLGKLILSQTETTDETGLLEVSIRPESDLKMGIYQVVGYTSGKDKLVSKLIVQ